MVFFSLLLLRCNGKMKISSTEFDCNFDFKDQPKTFEAKVISKVDLMKTV